MAQRKVEVEVYGERGTRHLPFSTARTLCRYNHNDLCEGTILPHKCDLTEKGCHMGLPVILPSDIPLSSPTEKH